MHLSRNDLWSLEEYSQKREQFREQVLAHKKLRTINLTEHLRFLFEDEILVRYQIQEMLRIEKLFEVEDIEDELAAYNPLIPNGSNLKATLMIEYESVEQRKKELKKFMGIEHCFYVQVGGLDRIFAIADEDMDRSDTEKTSSVHFLRFELTQDMIRQLYAGQPLKLGVHHSHLSHEITLAEAPLNALKNDLELIH